MKFRWNSEEVVKALNSKQEGHSYSFDAFRLYVTQRELFRGGELVALPPKTFDALFLMVSHHGHIVDKDEFIRTLWPDTFVEEDSLVQQISHLRKVLGERSDGGPYVETVARRGYRFAAPVTESFEKEPAESRVEVVRAIEQVTRSAGRRRLAWLLLGAAFVLAGGVTGRLVWRNQSASLPPARVVPLTTYPGAESYPTFSPNGDQVAFSWTGQNGDNTDIYVQLIGDTNPHRLTTHPSTDTAPAWSPDGLTIAFLRRQGERAQVILVPALGGPERKLAEVNIHYPRLTWSPDGNWLVTADQDSAGDPYFVVLVGARSGEKRRLLDPRPGSYGDYDAAISPDGRQLAFIRADSFIVGYLYVVELAAGLTPRGEPRRLTDKWSRHPCPAWTPDGRGIVFQDEETLWRVRVDTPRAEAELLQFAGGNAVKPAIAQHGERLAFTQEIVDLNVWRLDLHAPGGSTPPARNWISSTRDDAQAAYSPDGKRIAFASDRTGSGGIWTCNQDGSNAALLTSTGSAAGTPRWSPDGGRIAFDSRTDGRIGTAGKGDIWLVASGGGEPKLFTKNSAADLVPSWSRDGRWIYFASDRTGEFQVWKQPVAAGEAVQVTRKGGFLPIESPDEKWVYYSRSISGGAVLRVPVGGGEETQVLDSLATWGSFAVSEKGVYFCPVPEPGSRRSIRFYRFGDRSVETLLESEAVRAQTLSVSPDGRYLLYEQVDQQNADLMLVENFR